MALSWWTAPGHGCPPAFAWEAGSTHTLEFENIYPTLAFNGWSDGGGSTHDITVSGEPTTITANFTRKIRLDTGSPWRGVVKIEPSGSSDHPERSGSTYHELSSSVRLTAQPYPGFKFVTWIGDISGTENPQSLLMDSEWLTTVSGWSGALR